MTVIDIIGKRGIFSKLNRMLAKSTESAEPFIVMASLLAVFGHPLFYLIWKYLIPQPYENLSLRLLGSLLCVPLALKNHWPSALRRLLPYYWHLAVLFTLPFFFSLFLFLNGFSQVWVLSTIGATFLLTLVVTWYLAIVLFALGLSISYAIAVFAGEGITITAPLLEIIVVYLFVLCFGGAISLRLQRYREAQAAFEQRLRVISGQHAMVMKEHNHLLSRFLNNIIINRLRNFQSQYGLDRALELITQQEKRFCGIMQADIRNFTRMFDVDTELKVAELISQCFSETTHIGQDIAVVKPIGDCLFVYSDGDGGKEDAVLNIFALASYFVHSVGKINRVLETSNMAPLNFGIAVHAGEVIYGNLASDTMIDPTVIGLNVNKTARMEELTKSEAVRDRVGTNAVVMSEEFVNLLRARVDEPAPIMRLSLDELDVSIRDFPAVRTVYAMASSAAEAYYPLALEHIRSKQMARAPVFEVTERNVHRGVEYYYEMAGAGPNTTWAMFINVSAFPAEKVGDLVRFHYQHLDSRISRGREQWLSLSTENSPGEYDETEVEEWIIDIIERLSASPAAQPGGPA
jgi:class 3 adenylate cyclase